MKTTDNINCDLNSICTSLLLFVWLEYSNVRTTIIKSC